MDPQSNPGTPRTRYPATRLVEALRAGADLAVERSGRAWWLRVAGGDALTRYASKKAAVAALEEARAVLAEGLAACPPCAGLSGTAEERQRTRIITPQVPAGEPARYEVREAAQLVASHDPVSLAADIRYPPGVQERQYHADPSEARKVMVGAQNLDPALVLATTPSAVDGPPIVTEDGIALGGNGRLMMIRRVYGEDLPAAAAYRKAVVDRAAEFGQDRAAVAAMTAPILVRVVTGLTRSSPKRELVTAVRRYNEGLTNAMDRLAKAAAHGRQLADSTVDAFGEMLRTAPDSSLRDLMRDQPADFLRLLEVDGIVTNSNRAEWVGAGGSLSETAKDAVEAAFLGRVLGTADRLRATSPALLKKVERAVPHLVAIAGRNPAYSLVAEVQAAVDLLNRASAQHYELEQLLSQGEMFAAGPRPTDAVLAIARLFDRNGQRAVGERFAGWARAADINPHQRTMFFTPPTRDDTIATLVGEPMRAANPAPRFAVIERRTGPHSDTYRIHRFASLRAAGSRAAKLAARSGQPHEVRTWAPTDMAEWPVVEVINGKGERVRNPRCRCKPDAGCSCGCMCGVKRSRNPCGGKCLGARGPDCECRCSGRCHGHGTCACPDARRPNPGSSWMVHAVEAADAAEATRLLEQMKARPDFLNGRVLPPGVAGVTSSAAEMWRVETYHKARQHTPDPPAMPPPAAPGHPRSTPPASGAAAMPKKKTSTAGLQVAVVQDSVGRVRTALVREQRTGAQIIELLGVAERTALESAQEAARTIAAKLGLPLAADAILEVAAGRTMNPGPADWVPIIKAKARDVAGLAGELLGRLKTLPKKGAALVKASGVPEWLRVEFGPRGVRRVRVGKRGSPKLRAALQREVRARTRSRQPKCKRKAGKSAGRKARDSSADGRRGLRGPGPAVHCGPEVPMSRAREPNPPSDAPASGWVEPTPEELERRRRLIDEVEPIIATGYLTPEEINRAIKTGGLG